MDKVFKIVVPVGDYVLFKQIKKSETDGGIILPDAVPQDFGFRVLSVGEDVKRCKKGDDIIFPAKTPIQIMNEGCEKDIYLIEEKFIVGIIKRTKEIN